MQKIGVFTRRFSRRVDWWYNGKREVVSDAMKAIPGQLLHHDKIRDEDQLHYI